MPVLNLTNSVKGAMADAIIAAIDGGAGAATLKFYDGTIPTNADTAVGAQVLLGTLTCTDPCGSQTNGVITFSSITQDSAADATGTCNWARLATSAGTAIADFDVTVTAGTGSIKLNTISIVVGGPISMTSLTITVA